VVPRRVPHLELPAVQVEPLALAKSRAEDVRLGALARSGLSYDVRRLGDAVRAFGRAEHAGDDDARATARTDAGMFVGPALTEGFEAVAALRAVQLDGFLRELRAYLGTGTFSDELVALGGGFVAQALDRGWIKEERGKRSLTLDDGALRAVFKRRWREITGAQELPVDASEERALLGFLVKHPPISLPAPEPGFDDAGLARARSQLEGDYRLRKLDELARVDPSYPLDLARGVVLFDQGRFLLSVEAFRKHLDVAPDGPFGLRARNYLRTALERAQDGGT
jgi:hypothetical protein